MPNLSDLVPIHLTQVRNFSVLVLGQVYKEAWERSGSVVECLTQDRGTAGSSLTGVTALWSLSKTRHIYPSLVLVQPRKTCPV